MWWFAGLMGCAGLGFFQGMVAQPYSLGDHIMYHMMGRSYRYALLGGWIAGTILHVIFMMRNSHGNHRNGHHGGGGYGGGYGGGGGGGYALGQNGNFRHM